MENAHPSAAPSLRDCSDEELAVRIQKHDRTASAEFYTRHKSDVYQYSLRLLQNRQAAEDALQNAFLKFFSSIATLRIPSTVKSWLYSIVRNEIYSALRKNRSNGSLDDTEIASDETTDEIFTRQEDTELVQRLIRELEPDHHEVLYLLEYEQMTYAEIAHVIGVTVSTVGSRIFRARKELSKKLLPYMK